jgi:hypothetical protein
LAAALEHSGTPAIFANRPGGSVAVMLDSSRSASDRENVNVNGENAPADGFVVPAVNDGANAPVQPAMLKDDDGVASAPLHDKMSEVVVNVPHVSGLASAASGPPNSFRSRSLNGSCGFWLNTVVNCPVVGFGVTWPDRWTFTLSPAAARNSLYIWPGMGAPMYTDPVSWSGSNGVVIATVPTLDPFGQLPAANWASVQPWSPLATAGDNAVPAGNVTETFCTVGVARLYGC